MPESPEVSFSHLKDEIKKHGNVKDFKEEPIGFGLKALRVLIMIQDEGGDQAEQLADKIAKIKGVQSAEVEAVSLI
jgi:elongation factor 1-beta